MRTVFNLLGPLTNPAGAPFAVNGVFARERCELMARAHLELGTKRAMVVHGQGGLDEFAPGGTTFVAELRDSQVRTFEVSPRDFGLEAADPAGLRGGEPALNAERLLAALQGAPGRVAGRRADDRCGRAGGDRRRRRPAGRRGEGGRRHRRGRRAGRARVAAPIDPAGSRLTVIR